MNGNTNIGFVGKGVIASFIAVFSYIYNSFGVLFAILVVMMSIDYVTGFANAIIHKQASSRVGIIGIVKKVGYVTLVIMASLFDLAVLQGARQLGTTMPISNIFGTAIICWLISNESLSIIENLGAAGVPAPDFFIAAIKRVRKSVNDDGWKRVGDNGDEKNG